VPDGAAANRQSLSTFYCALFNFISFRFFSSQFPLPFTYPSVSPRTPEPLPGTLKHPHKLLLTLLHRHVFNIFMPYLIYNLHVWRNVWMDMYEYLMGIYKYIQRVHTLGSELSHWANANYSDDYDDYTYYYFHYIY